MRFQQKTPLAWLGDREWFNQSKAILSVVLPNRASGVFCWNEMLCRLTCACFYVIIHRWRLRWGYDKVEVLKKKTWTVWRKSCLINRRKESRERWISHSINLALLLMVCQWITKHVRGIFHICYSYIAWHASICQFPGLSLWLTVVVHIECALSVCICCIRPGKNFGIIK